MVCIQRCSRWQMSEHHILVEEKRGVPCLYPLSSLSVSARLDLKSFDESSPFQSISQSAKSRFPPCLRCCGTSMKEKMNELLITHSLALRVDVKINS